MTKHTIPLIIFVALLILMWAGLSLNPRELPSPLIGKEVPKFELPLLMEPEATMTHKDFENRVTVFNVFASWCVSCRMEHHLLIDMAKRGVNLFGLNYKDKRGDALVYLSRSGGNPYAAIAHDLKGDVGIEWGVYGTPETFVVDKEGVIRHKHTGPLNQQVIQSEILPLVAALERE
ncbi:MAG: DsbE family thiol:disulfide interchange protein [Hydrogenovibrio sp.]|uniref:DsbE family thiol:disulfide interchange protein n=1 Tax=Hydrogenovibrio sp. TaxID=2065821 RepID=UPI00286FF735|nr:DsbE family thiol:disulfide interchange protein [Hydrogenovibrio sp.]MDR9499903.1 DsbE family thiol:disulfide interchange protein [Hydrogenovibrio sp.]